MKNLIALPCIFVSLYLTSSPAISQPSFTGEALHELCTSKSDREHSLQLLSYFVAGVGTTMVIYGEIEPKIKSACLPTDGTPIQSLDLVCTYLKDHAELRQQPAAVLAIAAFREKFPCK